MGGIDPFGDIMGTSAGPAGEERKCLFKGKFSFTSISQQHQCGGTNTAAPMLTVSEDSHKYVGGGTQRGTGPATKAEKIPEILIELADDDDDVDFSAICSRLPLSTQIRPSPSLSLFFRFSPVEVHGC